MRRHMQLDNKLEFVTFFWGGGGQIRPAEEQQMITFGNRQCTINVLLAASIKEGQRLKWDDLFLPKLKLCSQHTVWRYAEQETWMTGWMDERMMVDGWMDGWIIS